MLLDASSHQPFITAKAVGRAGLQAVKQERLSVKTFVVDEAETKVRDIVNFELFLVNGVEEMKGFTLLRKILII